jgi:thiol-disulfide isomerase/thioredoxin
MSERLAQIRRRQRLVIWFALIFIAAVLVLLSPIRNQLLRYAVLHSETVNEDIAKSLIQRDHHPDILISQLWRTRKIPQRLAALDYLKTAPKSLVQSETPLISEAALDPDANARERALGLLQSSRSPRLLDFARAQLSDADPQIRLLGLNYLRATENKQMIPVLLQTLNDPDPTVAATADSVLRLWTGNDFGLRVRDILNDPALDPSATIEPDKLAAIRTAANKWNSWWHTNQSNNTAAPSFSISLPSRAEDPLAGDFTLKNLAGQSVRLSDFKNKIVLLNFWTTWCTACQEEIPNLIALQKNHPNDLVIVAISLDGVGAEDDDDIEFKNATNDSPPNATIARIHATIARIVQSRGINYPILLDPHGVIGARFNGFELPTNVLLDSNRVVRRRFIGARSLATLEAMLRDASFPAQQTAALTTR